MQYRVVIIQKRLPQYRKPFFEALRKTLAQREIELILIYGNPSPEQLQRQDNVDIDWAYKIDNREIRIGKGTTLIWQPCLRYLSKADLVIVEQANKLLLNYLLFVLYKMGGVKLALWGHGKNFQDASETQNLPSMLKRTMSKEVHWWFAYNERSAKVISDWGFPAEKITPVYNTIDVSDLSNKLNGLSEQDIREVKNRMGIQSDNIAIYSGSMYTQKRITFLLEACHRIKALVPDFEMIFIGAGKDQLKVENMAKARTWIHYMGPRFDMEKVKMFAISKLLLMPGLVGLAIIDAFVFKTPLITTDVPYHSPEIDYLVHGVNGMMIDETEDPSEYASCVAGLFSNPSVLRNLQEGCAVACRNYTLENMVDHYSRGIVKALQ